MTLARYLPEKSMVEKPGVKEFDQILRVLKERSAMNIPVVRFAASDRLIWRSSMLHDAQPTEIYSLSPSDFETTLALAGIASLLQPHGTSLFGIPAQSPNHAAVVLLIKAGRSELLLGADLEKGNHAQRGWTANLNSTNIPKAISSSVFKVPHHGSDDSHHPGVWSQLLMNQPFAILSPFAKGRLPRPQKSDAYRICSLTKDSYITALPTRKNGKTPSSVVNKAMAETTLWLKEVPSATGMVQLRKQLHSPAQAPWSVKLTGTAVSLDKLLSA